MWAYLQGGMGALSSAVASAARSLGVTMVNNAVVDEIVVRNGVAKGVRASFADGPCEIYADVVLSNCNPHHTFTELIPCALGTARRNAYSHCS